MLQASYSPRKRAFKKRPGSLPATIFSSAVSSTNDRKRPKTYKMYTKPSWRDSPSVSMRPITKYMKDPMDKTSKLSQIYISAYSAKDSNKKSRKPLPRGKSAPLGKTRKPYDKKQFTQPEHGKFTKKKPELKVVTQERKQVVPPKTYRFELTTFEYDYLNEFSSSTSSVDDNEYLPVTPVSEETAAQITPQTEPVHFTFSHDDVALSARKRLKDVSFRSPSNVIDRVVVDTESCWAQDC